MYVFLWRKRTGQASLENKLQDGQKDENCKQTLEKVLGTISA